MGRDATLKRILDGGIIAVVRSESPDQLVRVVRALADGGVTAAEITFTVPDALDVIRQVHRELGDSVVLGAGTVLDPETARAARADVDEIERAAAADDRQRAGGSVERLTGRLERAGRLATAGTALVAQLRVLGGWLGPLGERVLQALPG